MSGWQFWHSRVPANLGAKMKLVVLTACAILSGCVGAAIDSRQKGIQIITENNAPPQVGACGVSDESLRGVMRETVEKAQANLSGVLTLTYTVRETPQKSCFSPISMKLALEGAEFGWVQATSLTFSPNEQGELLSLVRRMAGEQLAKAVSSP